MKTKNSCISTASRLSVAPMMDWTDRHCRYFHRRFTQASLLYTEMVTTGAVLHGDRERLLGFDPSEHPVALQLGGADPEALAEATRIGCDFGYDEINLNIGCPSDRVQSGAFGAALMLDPRRVARCAAAMIGAAGDTPVTIKCRLGVDDQEVQTTLPAFLALMQGAGIRTVIIHARKAWLKGLSPKENRDIPPLDYGLVAEMKSHFPGLSIVINGGIPGLDAAEGFLAQGLDGVMLGRAAYQNPALLGAADARTFGLDAPEVTAHDAVRAMLPYIEAQLGRVTGLNQITRHMLGAFQGRPGAKAWRRHLSEHAHRPGAGPDLVEQALALVPEIPLERAS